MTHATFNSFVYKCFCAVSLLVLSTGVASMMSLNEKVAVVIQKLVDHDRRLDKQEVDIEKIKERIK